MKKQNIKNAPSIIITYTSFDLKHFKIPKQIPKKNCQKTQILTLDFLFLYLSSKSFMPPKIKTAANKDILEKI